MRGRSPQRRQHRRQRGRRKPGQAAGAGPPRQDVEPAFPMVHHRLRQRGLAGQHSAEVQPGHQSELDIHIGQPEIAIDQQHPPAAAGQGMRQSDGEPGLADAAFAGGDCDQRAGTRIRGAVIRGRVMQAIPGRSDGLPKTPQ